MFKFLANLFTKPAPCDHNPLDLENGFVVSTVDDFAYSRMSVKMPGGGMVSFFDESGREVFRIDRDGGRNV